MSTQPLRGEAGISLIETIVGLAIVATVGVALISGLATSISAAIIHREQATGEALARSQMEYIKEQPYSDNAWSYTVASSQRNSTQQPSWWDENDPPLLLSSYLGYSVSVTAEDFDADGDGTFEVPGDDDGIRKITLSVYHPDSDLVISLESNKVRR